MQEKNDLETLKAENNPSQRFFNVASFAVIICIIASAFTTYHYPKNQPELTIWGGTPLLATTFGPIIWLLFVALPLVLSVSFLFRNQYKMWRIGSYSMMWASILLGIIFIIMSVYEILSTIFAYIVCSFASLFGIFFVMAKRIDTAFNSCLAKNGVDINQTFGISIYLIYAAALISLFTLIHMAIKGAIKKT
ncbi:hypothetical protein [Bartonella sp. HY406]|uniref:hypothetical protein n=1 Tax=Bartonella sp. HY406 TaxID=2979331 RepID=UPI0021C631A2|nr:hypothetical protein [Bartonella sp. HY406]UXN03449.1 hypothetical protein N6B01_13605 [Bartonella sp. HY406]